MSWTPGPWTVNEAGYIAAGPVVIATMMGADAVQWEADARLIAAAPEMADELKDVREVLLRASTLGQREAAARRTSDLLARIRGAGG